MKTHITSLILLWANALLLTDVLAQTTNKAASAAAVASVPLFTDDGANIVLGLSPGTVDMSQNAEAIIVSTKNTSALVTSGHAIFIGGSPQAALDKSVCIGYGTAAQSNCVAIGEETDAGGAVGKSISIGNNLLMHNDYQLVISGGVEDSTHTNIMGLGPATSRGAPFRFTADNQIIIGNKLTSAATLYAAVTASSLRVTNAVDGVVATNFVSYGTNKWNAPTNVLGTTVKGQLPVMINGVTYYLDLKL